MTTLEEHLEDWIDERVGLRRGLSAAAVIVYLMGVTTVWLAVDQWTVAAGVVLLTLTVALVLSLRGLADASRLTDKIASRQMTRLALAVIFFATVMMHMVRDMVR